MPFHIHRLDTLPHRDTWPTYLSYPLLWNFTTTRLSLRADPTNLPQTRQMTYSVAIMVVFNEKLGRKCNIHSESQTLVLWLANPISYPPGNRTLLTTRHLQLCSWSSKIENTDRLNSFLSKEQSGMEDFLRIGQKLHKITHNSMKNRGSTTILTNLVAVHPRNTHTKFEANPCSCSREEVKHGILHSDI